MKFLLRQILLPLGLIAGAFALGRWQREGWPQIFAMQKASVPEQAAQATVAKHGQTHPETNQVVEGLLRSYTTEATDEDMAWLIHPDLIRPEDYPAIFAGLHAAPNSQEKDYAWQWLTQILANTHPEAIWPTASQMRDGELRAKYLAAALRYLPDDKTPPMSKEALDILASLPPGVETFDIFGVAFSGWMERDPNATIKVAFDLPNGPIRQKTLESLESGWAFEDLPAALKWAQSLTPPDPEVVDRMMSAASNWGSHNEEAQKFLMANLDKITDAETRKDIVQTEVFRLVHDNLASALDLLGKTANEKEQSQILHTMFSSFSDTNDPSFDPAKAAVLLPKIATAGNRDQLVHKLAEEWATTDPRAALAWAQALPEADAQVRTAAENAIISGWSTNDPAAALEFVRQSPDPAAFYNLATRLAPTLAESDPAAAQAWVDTLPDGANKAAAQSGILRVMAWEDFPTAWNTATTLADDTNRAAALSALVEVQANKDPAKAVALFDQLPAGPAQQNAAQVLAAEWSRQDPTAAAQWINTLPAGAPRNDAVAAYVSAVSGRDPAGALSWANTITSNAIRAEQVRRVMTTWAKTDPAAALAALPGANLTAEQKAATTAAIIQAQAWAK